MDEDVPQLMEAMAEKETKLKFSAEPPTVFTYLDEETAAQEVSWDDGQQISFQIYQELCSREKIRSQQEKAEMERLLRSSVAPSSSSSTYLSVKTVSPLEQPSADESLLGVTGRITYSTAPVDITRFNKNSM
ncbi:unnamed protein product [Gongylonema pulchrum]|uniref:UBX domain-containing protein n=1 Tax=Gongylonema pulchrum TaxID=637853 RepID=A0A183ER62_9BILA|nr:unnamed protein product [Gongylonema pulchrum]